MSIHIFEIVSSLLTIGKYLVSFKLGMTYLSYFEIKKFHSNLYVCYATSAKIYIYLHFMKGVKIHILRFFMHVLAEKKNIQILEQFQR